MENFKNPPSLWNYTGGFVIVTTVNLRDDSRTLLPGVETSKNLLMVKSGTIQGGLGTFHFTSDGHKFLGLESLIKCIRGEDSTLLWVNPDYWQEITDQPFPSD